MSRADQNAIGLDRMLAELGRMSLAELRAFWAERWGEPPAFRSREHLSRAAAYRLQSQSHGALNGASRRELAELAKRFEADRDYTPTPQTQLKPGSTVVREWGGQRHVVTVMDEGFIYAGRSYRSLSKIAGEITGTKWNGPLFFGLKARPASTEAR
jgi:hypothetical protein